MAFVNLGSRGNAAIFLPRSVITGLVVEAVVEEVSPEKVTAPKSLSCRRAPVGRKRTSEMEKLIIKQRFLT